MNLAFARRQTAFAATTEMIVVCADHNGFLFQFRIAAGQDADDIERGRFAAGDVNRKCDGNCKRDELQMNFT